jgi:hypothetical protein
MFHPDEVLQYLEPAYRLLTGDGIITWEYRYGMRGWLLPWLLAGPMATGQAVGGTAFAGIIAARIAAAAVGLIPVIAAWHLGRRLSPLHGIVAMAVMAVWYEQVVFSTHVLTETLATSLFLGAAAIVDRREGRGRIAAGGAMLALAVVLRFHYAVAAGVFLLLALGTDWKRWGWLILGAVPVLVLSGAVDIAMGQWPFGWAWANVEQNLIANKAAQFGEFGIEAYAEMLWLHWQVAIVPILWCAILGARRSPALAAAALVNLAVHLAIGHKEYRFILLTGEITILLAAIGSVDLIERLRGRVPVRPAIVALIATWGIASAALAASDVADLGWHRFESGNRLAREAALRPVCGVALVDGNYWATGGQTYLNRIPLYYILGHDAAAERAQFAATAQAYDAIIAAPDRGTIPANYRRLGCSGEGSERLCLAIRDGGCRHDAASNARSMRRLMEANGR